MRAILPAQPKSLQTGGGAGRSVGLAQQGCCGAVCLWLGAWNGHCRMLEYHAVAVCRVLPVKIFCTQRRAQAMLYTHKGNASFCRMLS